jgi:hypothetical protein
MSGHRCHEASRLSSMVTALVNALSDHGAEIRLRRQLAREAYRLGRADGFKEGYERSEADMARRWAEVAVPVSKGGPTHEELEARRWGPGGRDHFADPRPGDFIPQSRQETAA